MYIYIATNPDMKKAPKVDHGFKMTSDGRLIIKDDDDEEEDKSKGRRTSFMPKPFCYEPYVDHLPFAF